MLRGTDLQGAMRLLGEAHYFHHKYCKYNYSDGSLPLDKWFDTFHDRHFEFIEKYFPCCCPRPPGIASSPARRLTVSAVRINRWEASHALHGRAGLFDDVVGRSAENRLLRRAISWIWFWLVIDGKMTVGVLWRPGYVNKIN